MSYLSFGRAHLVAERALTRRLPPTLPSLAAGRGGAGKEGPALLFLSPPLAAARVVGRTAAAAGSCWTCWLSQERSAPSPSWVLCCRLCLTAQGRKREKTEAWKEVALHPPRSAGPACLAAAAHEEHLLLLQIATASGQLLDKHSSGFESVYFWSQNVRRLDDSLLPRHLWRAGRRGVGKEGSARLFLSFNLAAAQVEAWLEGMLLRLALAGPAGDLKERSAPSPSRMLCYRL